MLFKQLKGSSLNWLHKKGFCKILAIWYVVIMRNNNMNYVVSWTTLSQEIMFCVCYTCVHLYDVYVRHWMWKWVLGLWNMNLPEGRNNLGETYGMVSFESVFVLLLGMAFSCSE